MVEHPQNVLKKRDKKEGELTGLKESINAMNQTEVRAKRDFDKLLNAYQTWKNENNITGIKY